MNVTDTVSLKLTISQFRLYVLSFANTKARMVLSECHSIISWYFYQRKYGICHPDNNLLEL